MSLLRWLASQNLINTSKNAIIPGQKKVAQGWFEMNYALTKTNGGQKIALAAGCIQWKSSVVATIGG